MPIKRRPTHAGSWYSGDASTLSRELDTWLASVPASINGISVPRPAARVIIAPHAGYSYSGPTAAWAYKSLDVSNAKRVFLLGPSHHYYLTNCALSEFAYYSTPFGDLKLDQDVMAKLYETEKFSTMKPERDEDEHSLELHLPYIFKILSKYFTSANFPTLVPILVGNTTSDVETEFGEILAPYLTDPENVFVVSSDFAHWGLRFSYTNYLSDLTSENSIRTLKASDKNIDDPKIYESIDAIDKMTIEAIKTGEHKSFLRSLRKTGNTVCGRHPIGIVMAAMEHLQEESEINDARFQFVQYTRSSNCVKVSDSSVSYVSAYVVIEPTSKQ